jgi:dTDP-4-amino-4,6-dideoxygalactose transaminase
VHTPLHRLLQVPGFPQTENAWRQCMSIPIYPSLSKAETQKIVRVMGDILSDASSGTPPPVSS